MKQFNLYVTVLQKNNKNYAYITYRKVSFTTICIPLQEKQRPITNIYGGFFQSRFRAKQKQKVYYSRNSDINGSTTR